MDFVLRMKDVAPRIWGVDFPENINFEVKPGEVWCILGENGSGKTMLLDLISGKSGIQDCRGAPVSEASADAAAADSAGGFC